MGGSDVEVQASGYVFRDRASGGVVTYVPGLADWTRACSPGSRRAISCSSTGRSGATTSWPGWGSPTAAPATWDTCRSRGPAGRSRRSHRLERPRKVLVHINNTNPILLEDSPERDEVVRAGIEVAYDGLEVHH